MASGIKSNSNIKILVVVLVAVFALFAVLLIHLVSKSNKAHEGMAKTPSGSSIQAGRDYGSVVADFKEKGFTNIETEAIEDLITGWLKKDGAVEKVSVGGDVDYSPDVWMDPSTPVVIYYHTFPGKGNETGTNEQASSNVGNSKKSDKNGFNDSTNNVVTMGYCQFEIPSYWDVDAGTDSITAYAEKGEKLVMLNVMNTKDSDPVSYDMLVEETDNGKMAYALQDILSSQGSVGEVKSSPYSYGGIKGMIYEMDFETSGIECNCKSVWIPNEIENKWLSFFLITSNQCTYNYNNDFEKTLRSISIGEATEEASDDYNVDESEDENATNENTSNASVEVPIMKGTNVDRIIKKAAEYGVVQKFDTESWYDDYNVLYMDLSDSSGGLQLSLIYDDDTKELLCGEILTTKLASESEQKNFIKGMAPLLCPSADSKTLDTWVSSNYGKESRTTVDGFVYSLEFGAVENPLYFAGHDNWEDWNMVVDPY